VQTDSRVFKCFVKTTKGKVQTLSLSVRDTYLDTNRANPVSMRVCGRPFVRFPTKGFGQVLEHPISLRSLYERRHPSMVVERQR
jgi:hypothetical protein